MPSQARRIILPIPSECYAEVDGEWLRCLAVEWPTGRTLVKRGETEAWLTKPLKHNILWQGRGQSQ
jgi:hypothetical protein